MVGVPVIINHKDVNKKNADDLRVGVVNSVWYDNKDGWYWCDGIIWDETAQNLITDKNWSVSCSYDVKTANNEGGTENNIKYDMEFLDGVFTHLAIVNNPRYERANIVFNSKTEVINDKWITIKPHGNESDDYRRLKLEDGETPKEAIDRVYKKEDKKEDSYYEPDMEETYSKSYEDSIAKDFEEFMKSKKEEPEKSDLDIKREAYETAVKKLNDAGKRKWNPKDDADWYAAVKEESEAKKALTDLRRDYAEAIMSSFEEVEDNPYDDKIAQKQARYEELSEKASTDSDRLSKQSHDMISAIPMGQPILVGHHSEMRDRRYRQRAWDKMDKAYQLSKKADYYADKAKSVGKSGISADDKNAIKKLSDKYNSIKRSHQRMIDANKIIKSKGTDEEKQKKLIESGWSEQDAVNLTTPSKWSGSVGFAGYQLTSNTAEMRRIIDRVIDIHSRSLKAVDMDANTDYSDYGFEVERNTDINRLQLKFPGKPDASVREVLKSNGFRWSPREGAWQRQLTGNAEYSLKRVMEKLKANNSKEQDMALLEELKKLITKVENDKGDDNMEIENEKVDKRDIIRQIMAIAGKHEDNEDVKTIAKLAEKLAYDASEAGKADNEKEEDEKEVENKCKNEDEEDKDKVAELKEEAKEDAENCKVKNSKEDFYEKMNEIYNSSKESEENSEYVSRDEKIKAAEEYFA